MWYRHDDLGGTGLVTSVGFCTGSESIDVLLVAQPGVPTIENICITNYSIFHYIIFNSLQFTHIQVMYV